MTELALHPATVGALAAFAAKPSQAVVLAGPNGIGKGSLLQLVAQQLLDTPALVVSDHPQIIAFEGADTIGIDEVRRVQHFLALKPTSAASNTRIIAIEHAERLTTEAQNALLKLVEEPPLGSHFIFTVSSPNKLLPTIVSRVQVIALTAPSKDQLSQHFSANHPTEAVQRALMLSGGLPGAMSSLLNEDSDHPLLAAVDTARELLQAPKFERLIRIDALAKDRQAATQVCEVLSQMASVSLRREGITTEQLKRWQNVLQESLSTAEVLRRNGQAKLALTAMSLKI